MDGWQEVKEGVWRKQRESGLLLDIRSMFGGFSWIIRRSEGEVPLYKGHTQTLETAKMLADETAVRKCELNRKEPQQNNG